MGKGREGVLDYPIPPQVNDLGRTCSVGSPTTPARYSPRSRGICVIIYTMQIWVVYFLLTLTSQIAPSGVSGTTLTLPPAFHPMSNTSHEPVVILVDEVVTRS